MNEAQNRIVVMLIVLLTLGIVAVWGAWRYLSYPTLSDLELPSCDRLPPIDVVQQTIQLHVDATRAVEDRSRGIWIEAASAESCSGKGYIHIYYDTLETRRRIKDMLGNTFFGVPYIMQNT